MYHLGELETACRWKIKTITIVNNSWGYPISTYDINSALFDEAVRDSTPYRSYDQPITHVFPAGNSGGANSGGTGGSADTINSPGNAKNVITVGASFPANTLAEFIASVKAGFVAGVFMHLSDEKKTIYNVLICTVFFLIGLMALTIWAMHDQPFQTLIDGKPA